MTSDRQPLRNLRRTSIPYQDGDKVDSSASCFHLPAARARPIADDGVTAGGREGLTGRLSSRRMLRP
jgi:hypothetical protein